VISCEAVPELAVAAVLGLLAAALAALALRRGGPRWATGAALVAAGSLAAAASLLVAAATHRVPPSPPAPDDVPLQQARSDDATSRACRACHPDQYASWHASYHRTMTQVASPDTALGDFQGAEVHFAGQRYRMFERDGQLFAETGPAQGNGHQPPVRLVQTTGSHHLQIYWVAAGAGRTLEAFPLLWLRGEERWIPRHAVFIAPPVAQSTVPGVWNYTCIGCHTTHPRPELTFGSEPRTDSTVTEFGIACEACHGSGAEHIAAYRSPLDRYRAHFGIDSDPKIVEPSRLTHRRSAQVCGQCHSVRTFYSDAHAREWSKHGFSFRPGDDLDQAVSIISNATLDRPYTQRIAKAFPEFISGSFWDDGIVRVVGREYNALLESGCFQRGELSCISCHELHQAPGDPRDRKVWANDQLSVGMESDRACTQCHESLADAQAAAAHAHHEPGSSGSACLNCHMPHTAYGLLKAVRSHEIHSPRVLTSGPGSSRPNACNLCHLDRSLGWTAEALSRWYGQEMPALSDDDRRIAAGVRWVIAGDAGVRALTAWSMGWAPAQQASGASSPTGTTWLVPYLLDVMEQDPYDAVRMVAARSLRAIPDLEPAQLHPLAQPERRAAEAQALREQWAPAPLPPEFAARALYDAQGRRLTDEISRLRTQRDDRPLILAE
jgi:Cytochrome c554 and c-prime